MSVRSGGAALLHFGLAAGLAMVTVIAGPAAAESPADGEVLNDRERRRVLRLSPVGAPPPDPSNAVADQPAAARLGERLFFDRRLSVDGSMSCASCHDPSRDWTDGKITASPGTRFPKNTPSLWNTAHNRWFTWNGRADSAWSQALLPLESPDEMANNRLRLLHLVRTDPILERAWTDAFGPLPPDLADELRFPSDARPIPDEPEHPWQQAWASMAPADRRLADRLFARLGKAIAAFERRLISGESPFDRFVAALRDGDPTGGGELTGPAVRGLRHFVGSGQCTLCHSGPLLTDGEFHDVGIAFGAGGRLDPGRHRGVLTLLASPFHREGPYADAPTPAAPVRFLDARTEQFAQFKTPSLRNVARTAPYMHDGRFADLETVVRFYVTRDGALPRGHPSPLLQPLDWSDRDIAEVVAFLESLSSDRPASIDGRADPGSASPDNSDNSRD